jgi:hypothetical protein
MEPERLVSNVCHHFDLGHVLDWRMLEGGEDISTSGAPSLSVETVSR